MLGYGEKQEFILKGGKQIAINDLKRQIIKFLDINITEDEIDLSKHNLSQFEWKEINLKYIQRYKESQLKAISKKKGKKKKGGTNSKTALASASALLSLN